MVDALDDVHCTAISAFNKPFAKLPMTKVEHDDVELRDDLVYGRTLVWLILNHASDESIHERYIVVNL